MFTFNVFLMYLLKDYRVDFSSDTIWILTDGFLYFHDFYINFLFNGFIARLQNEIPSLERDSWIFSQ